MAVLAAMGVSGCIPNGGYAYHPADAPPPAEAPAPEPQRVQVPAPPTTPPWEARPVVADARTVAAGSYVVQQGDTLRGIAARTGASADAIARANGLAPTATLAPGRRLTIPGGRYHLVKPGESGIAIARAYGVRWTDILAANDLSEPFVLRAGRRLRLPDQHYQQPTLKERAAAFRIDLGDVATGGGEPAIPDNAAPVRAVAKPRPLPPTVALADPETLHGSFAWPVAKGEVIGRFGAGTDGNRNDGIKIAVPIGTPVHAVAEGVVIYTSTNIPGLGGIVMIKHGDGWTSIYGHDSRILVQRGQAVKRGQTVAYSGDTGQAARPELHFELRQGRTPVDPLTQLSPQSAPAKQRPARRKRKG